MTRIGSLCTGIGGLDLAAMAVYDGYLAWYSELEPAPCSVLEREHSGIPNLGDLTALDWSTVPPVDVLTAGYPCQPFSTAGRRQGADDDRHLWPFIAEAVRVLRPRRVVLENVAGHLSLGFGDVLGDLAEAGFDAEWCVLRASDVGAPHRRARLFIVAADADRGGWGEGGLAGVGRPLGAWRDASDDRATAADSGSDVATDADGEGPQRRRRNDVAPGESEAASHDRGATADAENVGHERSRPARRRGTGPENSGDDAPDPNSERLSGWSEHDGQPQTGRLGERAARNDSDRLGMAPVAWGRYEPAIRRWEHVLGRPAPAPTDDRRRLNPPFVEWMMGFPAGWTGDLTRTAALKALGNAVCPQQGTAAVALLEDAS